MVVRVTTRRARVERRDVLSGVGMLKRCLVKGSSCGLDKDTV